MTTNRATTSVLVAATVTCLSTVAVALDAPVDEPVPTPERRSGLLLGLETGLWTGTAHGYPNTIAKLDNPDYLADTGLAFGPAVYPMVGVAMRDWFTFSLGYSQASFGSDDLDGTAFAFILRTDAFPLYSLGGAWRDAALFAIVGAGSAELRDKDDAKVASAGSMSVVGLGAHYEWWRPWQLSVGPSVDYRHTWSPSWSGHALTAGLRVSYHGGP